jgi:hypothetical protein
MDLSAAFANRFSAMAAAIGTATAWCWRVVGSLCLTFGVSLSLRRRTTKKTHPICHRDGDCPTDFRRPPPGRTSSVAPSVDAQDVGEEIDAAKKSALKPTMLMPLDVVRRDIFHSFAVHRRLGRLRRCRSAFQTVDDFFNLSAQVPAAVAATPQSYDGPDQSLVDDRVGPALGQSFVRLGDRNQLHGASRCSFVVSGFMKHSYSSI